MIERPLLLISAEAGVLTDAITDDMVSKVSSVYDADKAQKALAFSSLPRGIRTAIVSVWYQFGYPDAYPDYPKFWNFVTKNDWKGAVKELRNFYSNPSAQAPGDLRRRNNEADIIEATLEKCSRSVDLVFLLDESGSVTRESFIESLDFVKNVINAFPDDKLKGTDGTRFGLSTFNNSYTPHFYLSSFTNRYGYLAAVDGVKRSSGGTNLGSALNRILYDQFRENRGLRPEVDGLPRILIVLTEWKITRWTFQLPLRGYEKTTSLFMRLESVGTTSTNLTR